ncbi:hypothetical protein [Prochlorothrix hollandica]|uniref:Uncharacterized protein n=1 Tax=Prochlorothrix hollandica PCC 9006 = CALU 1027 TaxID=317619 RepID=A0A0M2PV02_PROHO|nr:hypothetical protein [Prochlorothrix hollandica]KKJ00321.1 hypothetical protein PROH_11680 [Prochlorothrix hollandica PCC 9006 = CALU 1027]
MTIPTYEDLAKEVSFDMSIVLPVGTRVIKYNDPELVGIIVGVNIPCNFEIEDFIYDGQVYASYKVLGEFDAEWYRGHEVTQV